MLTEREGTIDAKPDLATTVNLDRSTPVTSEEVVGSSWPLVACVAHPIGAKELEFWRD